MKLPDVNLLLHATDLESPRHAAALAWVQETLLLHATDLESPRHAAALAWVQETLSGTETVAFAWATLIAFVRLTTNPAVFERPLALDDALDLIDGWLARPCATVVAPTDRHAAVLREMLRPLGTAGNLTSDAHLAALAVEHGAVVYSCDADFARFPGVRRVDPLA